MRWFLLSLMSLAALSASANEPEQITLPNKFFLECTTQLGGQKLLVFVDRTTNTFEFKRPHLLKVKFKEDADGLHYNDSGDRGYFNKWNGHFKHSILTYEQCGFYEPGDLKPLVK